MQQIEFRWKPEDLLPAKISLAARRAVCGWPVKWEKRILLEKLLAGEQLRNGRPSPPGRNAHPS